MIQIAMHTQNKTKQMISSKFGTSPTIFLENFLQAKFNGNMKKKRFIFICQLIKIWKGICQFCCCFYLGSLKFNRIDRWCNRCDSSDPNAKISTDICSLSTSASPSFWSNSIPKNIYECFCLERKNKLSKLRIQIASTALEMVEI